MYAQATFIILAGLIVLCLLSLLSKAICCPEDSIIPEKKSSTVINVQPSTIKTEIPLTIKTEIPLTMKIQAPLTIKVESN